jgi:hypothetical protein
MRFSRWIGVLVLGLFFPANEPAARAQAKLDCGPSAQAWAGKPPRVTDVYREISHKGKRGIVRSAKLRDTVTVRVENLETLIARAQCYEKSGTPKDIVLYLDRRPLNALVAYPPTDPTEKALRFELRRTEAARDVWTHVLGKPTWPARGIDLSVGFEGEYAIPSKRELSLAVIPHGWFTFWGLLFGMMAVFFLVLAWKSDVLRDTVPPPGGEARRPFSLSRTQAAWWFFLVLGAYLFIGMITGDFSTSITGTVLALLGISAGTAVGSSLIDASKQDEAAEARRIAEVKRLEDQLAAVRSRVQQLTAAGNESEFAKLKEEEKTTLSLLRKVRNESEDFLRDILSDANGVSFHRFQNAAWTLVLGIIFVSQVYRDLAMPQFNGTLLGLMGLSAGTFLGMKIPEPTTPKT